MTQRRQIVDLDRQAHRGKIGGLPSFPLQRDERERGDRHFLACGAQRLHRSRYLVLPEGKALGADPLADHDARDRGLRQPQVEVAYRFGRPEEGVGADRQVHVYLQVLA